MKKVDNERLFRKMKAMKLKAKELGYRKLADVDETNQEHKEILQKVFHNAK